MPSHGSDECRYLRSVAAKLRDWVADYPAPLSAAMLKMADDLETRASEIEAPARREQ